MYHYDIIAVMFWCISPLINRAPVDNNFWVVIEIPNREPYSANKNTNGMSVGYKQWENRDI